MGYFFIGRLISMLFLFSFLFPIGLLIVAALTVPLIAETPSSRIFIMGLFDMDLLADMMLPIMLPMALGEASFLQEDII
jgi:hypothetical protein